MVTIKTAGGAEVTVLKGEAVCADKVLDGVLNGWIQMKNYSFSPGDGDPDYIIAKDLVEVLGGEITEYADEDIYPEDAVI